MNLIEQLGGYEKAKVILQGVGHEHDDLLLVYRRENNIFEVGDKVVFTDDFMHDEIMTTSNVNDAEIYMDDDSKRAISVMVRHATPEEIQAGRRL